jgi:hypothetical protein
LKEFFLKNRNNKVLTIFRNLRDENLTPITIDYLRDKFDGLTNPKLVFWHKVYFGDSSDNIPKSFEKDKKVPSKKKIVDYIIDNSEVYLEFIDYLKEILKEKQFNSLNDVIKFFIQEDKHFNETYKLILIDKLEQIVKRKIDLSQFFKNLLLVLLRDFQISNVYINHNSDNIEQVLNNYDKYCSLYNFKKVPSKEDYNNTYKLLVKNNNLVINNIFTNDNFVLLKPLKNTTKLTSLKTKINNMI